MNAKKITGAVVKAIIALVVLAYLGLHTINFFMYTFPPEQWYLSWLGFGLTGGGLIGYLIVFLWDDGTILQKWVALIMVVVCGIGEVAAAGFGMTIEAWAKSGWTMTEQDFNMMLLAIRALAFTHFLALVVYTAGNQIGELFGDHDKDGVINALDPDYRVFAKDVRQTDIDRLSDRAKAAREKAEQINGQLKSILADVEQGNGTDPTHRQGQK
jgi:hypothetical protein